MTGHGRANGRVFSIGPLHGEDVPTVADLMARAFDPAFGEAWSQAQCLAIFTLPGYRMTGAWSGAGRDRTLTGFSIDRSVGGQSELLLLGVDPALRRAGIGRILVDEWIDHCGNRDVQQAFLEVRADNPARLFYESLGFAPIGRRPSYYRGNDGKVRDAITMSRPLP